MRTEMSSFFPNFLASASVRWRTSRRSSPERAASSQASQPSSTTRKRFLGGRLGSSIYNKVPLGNMAQSAAMPLSLHAESPFFVRPRLWSPFAQSLEWYAVRVAEVRPGPVRTGSLISLSSRLASALSSKARHRAKAKTWHNESRSAGVLVLIKQKSSLRNSLAKLSQSQKILSGTNEIYMKFAQWSRLSVEIADKPRCFIYNM